MTQYRFRNGKAVVDDLQDEEDPVVIDLSQDDDDEERPRKKAKRNEPSSGETISSSPTAETSSSSNRSPQSDPPDFHHRDINRHEAGSRTIPAQAKRVVAMAILHHGIDRINRAELSAEVSLELELIDVVLIN